MNATEIVMRYISALIFALIGYSVANKIPRGSRISAWVVFILGSVLASDVLRNVWLIAVDQFAIYLSSALCGLGIGILLAFVVKGGHKAQAAV